MKTSKNRMRSLILIITSSLFLVVLCVGTIVTPEVSFSENENRYLTKLSDVLSADILSGEFQQQLMDYTSDQMPGRDLLTASATAVKKLSGRKDIGGAYIGRDGFYFDKKLDKDMNFKRYERNLKKIENIALKYSDKTVTAMLVPESGDIYSGKLPVNAQLFNDAAMYDTAGSILKNCRVIDLRDVLKSKKGDLLYYRTDHHWTLDGAYAGYEAFTGKKCSYDTIEVCDDFLGTLYSKVLDKSAVKKVSEGGSLDTIKIPVLAGKVQVTADGRDIGMFDMNALKEKDKYRVFFGGNYGITDIKSGSNDRKLVVVKDSFANCFVPLLTEDYGEIVMVDMRYFSGNIDMIAGAADEILFLYELSNFAGDSNIAKLGM